MRDVHPVYDARSKLGFIHESIFIAVFVLAVVAAVVFATARAEPVAPAEARVIDGDTIAVRSMVRLVGFNAPETADAACQAEPELDYRAKRRLAELIGQWPTDLQLLPCSCPVGIEGTKSCNHGRRCGLLTVAGPGCRRNVDRGRLSRAVPIRKTMCPPTPRPRC